MEIHRIMKRNERSGKNKTFFDKYNEKLQNFDEKNEASAISQEFLLGDVVFLKGDSRRRLIFKGINDLWLGNGGFSGRILQRKKKKKEEMKN